MNVNQLRETIEHCIQKHGLQCDLNHLDISHYSSLDGLFANGVLSRFNGDISRWDTSNVISMREMFDSSNFNGDISQWNVSKATNMHRMFSTSAFKGDISRWDVSNVKNMRNMFEASTFNSDISAWNVSKVEDMSEMFRGSPFNGDISKWNVAHVRSMAGMFLYTSYRGDFSNWNVAQVRNMDSMFAHSGYNGDLSRWDVSSVTNMGHMLHFCHIDDISQWNVANVLDFNWFMNTGSCNCDLGGWMIDPDANVSGMLANAEFQGTFPRVPMRGECVLPETYFGDLSNNYTLEEAKRLVDNKKWLDLYLKTTAPQGLAPLHMAKATTLKTKPAWMSTEDFKWTKNQYILCLGLGMGPRESAQWMADALHQRKTVPTSNASTLSFDFSFAP